MSQNRRELREILSHHFNLQEILCRKIGENYAKFYRDALIYRKDGIPMTDILMGKGPIVTLASDNRLIEQGAVLVHDDRIAAIGSDTSLRQQHPGARYVDANAGLIMPGFLCTHTHFYGAFARGMAIPGKPPRNFPQILERLWGRLDKLLTLEDTRASAEMFLADAIRNVTTLVVVHHPSPNGTEGVPDCIALGV